MKLRYSTRPVSLLNKNSRPVQWVDVETSRAGRPIGTAAILPPGITRGGQAKLLWKLRRSAREVACGFARQQTGQHIEPGVRTVLGVTVPVCLFCGAVLGSWQREGVDLGTP